VGAHRLTTMVFHLSTTQQFLLLAALMLATALLALRMLPQDALRVVGLLLARLRYSVRAVGVDRLPKTGGALIDDHPLAGFRARFGCEILEGYGLH
jgi:hypothetical protein